MSYRQTTQATTLDLLEAEDLELRAIFGQVLAAYGPGVEERASYGDLAKAVIHRVATREAALVDIASVVAKVPELDDVSERLSQQSVKRREALDRVERMSRGVQGINLNTGQDFDKELGRLIEIVGSEIEWDLAEAVPSVRRALAERGMAEDLSSARKVSKRAPTNLDPRGPRWFERAPLIARAIAVYDRLRDFPRAARRR